MASHLLAGIPISSRFAEKLGIAQEKQDQQQMTHTKSSIQTVNYEEEQEKALSLAPWPNLEGAPTVDLKEKAVDLAIDLNPIGSVLNTIRKPLRENFLRRIEREVPELYRETNGSRFLNFFGGNYPFGAPRWNFAETPDMALGQGNNKGLRFKIKTEGLEGKVNRDKPGLEQAYLSGMGEFIVVAQPSDLLKNLKEVVISPEAFTGLSRGEKKRLENTLIQLENKGVPVKRVTTEDFYTMPKVSRPKVVNSIYPKMPGATLKDTKWVQRNVHDEAEIQDILSSGYMLPKPGGKNQKYFTAVDEVDPQTTAKNILRIKRDKVDPELAVKLEDVEIFNRESNTWEPLSKRKEINEKPKEGLNEISSPIEDLEASVKEQVKQLDNTGWNRLPGAAGKRDSDVQPTFLQKMYKEHPDLVKSKPSELEKLEIKLRRIYKLPEEEIEDIMLPLWSTYLRNQKPDDPAEEHTQKTKMKRWTENEESPLLTAVEKLAGMIEGMNKPRTVIRDKDGRIMGVA